MSRIQSLHTNSLNRPLRSEQLESRLMLSSVPPSVSDVNVSSSLWTQGFIDHLETSGLGSAGYSIPVGSSSQLSSLPWTSLDEISISFDEDVHIQQQDLSISGVVNSEYAIQEFFYDPATRTATWGLATPIAAGERIRLDLDGDSPNAVEDLDGNALDGEWTDSVSTYASGDGTAGGDFEFSFNVLKGDAIANDLVDYYDYIYTRYAEGFVIGDPGYAINYDIDGNGAIETADWMEVLSNLWATLPVGTPPGAINDAPTTSGFDLLFIDDRQSDYTVAADLVFDDAEDTPSGLTYAISSNSNPSLFDAVSINSSTGEVTLNALDSSSATGRSRIVITATDSGGLSVSSTLTVDVDYVNQPPVITDYGAVDLGLGFWAISGIVSDADDDVEGLIVNLYGVIDARAVVRSDGSFLVTVSLQNGQWGYEYASVVDQHGDASNLVSTFIGLT